MKYRDGDMSPQIRYKLRSAKGLRGRISSANGDLTTGHPLKAVGDLLPEVGRIVGFKRGGTVKKTGIALVHKGEHVLTKEQADRYKQFPRKKKHFIKRSAGRARYKKDGKFKLGQ
jgi:hypothetical protein